MPEGLKEQIIAERQVRRPAPVWQKAVLLAGACAALAIMISWLYQGITPGERHDFAAYRAHMGSFAAKSYYMDYLTSDLDQIRLYLSDKKAIADYVLPQNLEKNATAAGCVSTKWQGQNVSMICFKSGCPFRPANNQTYGCLSATGPSPRTRPPPRRPRLKNRTAWSLPAGRSEIELTCSQRKATTNSFLENSCRKTQCSNNAGKNTRPEPVRRSSVREPRCNPAIHHLWSSAAAH